MSLVTGTPLGTIVAQDELYIEGAPNIYFMNVSGSYAPNDIFTGTSKTFYWGLSGTVSYPVYQLGCYENVTLSDSVDINQVRCDTVGDKDVIQKRNHMELKFTLKSFIPLTNIAPLLHGGAVSEDTGKHVEAMGLGQINNSEYWKIYLPKVYDEGAGDYVSITGHRCKFVGGGEWSMSYGNVWSMPVTIWLMADESKTSDQMFATIIRTDASNI